MILNKFEMLPTISPILNDNSWDVISEVSKAGTGNLYWDIGDCKAVTLNGKIGNDLTLNNVTLYVFILDFNHPINKSTADNNIIWGGFKTAVSGGVDVVLRGASYGTYKTDGSIIFNMNHWGNYNYGGWKGSDFRYDILGGTSTKPSGYKSSPSSGRTGYNATQATIDNPVTNTLMAALPNDLRAVLRLWNRYVDYVGGASNTDANCSTPTIDAISLLAEWEVFGSPHNANEYERNHQKQVTYYANGNSRVKYMHDNITSLIGWWIASPSRYSASNHDHVNGSGGCNGDTIRYSRGISPAFRT